MVRRIKMGRKSISSGILDESCRVYEQEGWLQGLILTGGGVDAKVILYDSADEDLVDATEIGFVSQGVPFFDFMVHCVYGIYAQVDEGAEFMVLYSKQG